MRVLVVDDEPLVLNGLASIIQRQEVLHIDLLCALNGFDALSKLEYFSPDLVITDILMPEMSGFELIDEIKKRHVCRRFVILTGYADFEYARQAIQVRAIDYLLKPIDKEKLISLLRKVSEEVNEESDMLIKQELERLRNVLLYDVPYDEVVINERILKDIFPYNNFTVIVMQCEEGETSANTKIIQDILSPRFSKVYILAMPNRKQLTILANSHNELKDDEITTLCNSLSHIHLDKTVLNFHVGISFSSGQLHHLNNLYTRALKSLYFFKFITKEKHRFYFSELQNLSTIYSHELIGILRQGDRENAKEKVKEYLDKIVVVNMTDAEYLKCACSMIISDINVYLNNMGISLDEVMEKSCDLTIEIGGISTFDQLLNIVTQVILLIFDYYGKNSNIFNYNENVKKMLDFIKKNYHLDISLDNMAEAIHLHPNYASTLFKKETGTSFVQYLNSFRINKAKELLRSNYYMPLGKIAKMVGYENQNHFFKVFKKYCGITPGEYRSRGYSYSN